MMAIQLLLITGVLLILVYWIQRMESAVSGIIIMAALSGLAIFFILQPEITNRVAHKIGVGRGADLVFYISILIFWFVVLRLYARLRKLEQMMTEIIRKNALENAVKNTGNSVETKSPDEEQH